MGVGRHWEGQGATVSFRPGHSLCREGVARSRGDWVEIEWLDRPWEVHSQRGHREGAPGSQTEGIETVHVTVHLPSLKGPSTHTPLHARTAHEKGPVNMYTEGPVPSPTQAASR